MRILSGYIKLRLNLTWCFCVHSQKMTPISSCTASGLLLSSRFGWHQGLTSSIMTGTGRSQKTQSTVSIRTGWNLCPCPQFATEFGTNSAPCVWILPSFFLRTSIHGISVLLIHSQQHNHQYCHVLLSLTPILVSLEGCKEGEGLHHPWKNVMVKRL